MNEPTNRVEVNVPREALRDVASADVVERVWQRIESELEPQRQVSRQRPSVVWALAASALTFALGLAIGREGALLDEPARLATRAEPRVQGVPAVGANTETLERAGDGVGEGPGDPSESLSGRDDERRNSGWAGPTKELLSGHPEAEVPPLVLEASELLEAPQPLEVPVAEPVATTVHPPSWQRLANSGEYEAALFELGQDGGFETALLDSNAEQLMLLADVARATGQTQRALAALRRIVSEFRGEPVAPLAAYSLGNLLEKSGDARSAAQAFAVYRALSPEGDFAEDALVRQLRSAVERDDRDYAKQLAAQYRVDFPEGRRGEEVAHWLEELAAREAALQADAGGESEEPRPPAEANEDSKRDAVEPAPGEEAPPPAPEE